MFPGQDGGAESVPWRQRAHQGQKAKGQVLFPEACEATLVALKLRPQNPRYNNLRRPGGKNLPLPNLSVRSGSVDLSSGYAGHGVHRVG